MASISSEGLNADNPVTATKSCLARSSSDIPDGNQPVLVVASINELLNRSLRDPPMARRVSGSGAPRRISTGAGLPDQTTQANCCSCSFNPPANAVRPDVGPVSFRYEGDQWIRIMDTVSGTVRIAQSRHRGMPDVIVNRNRLVWDGTKYPG